MGFLSILASIASSLMDSAASSSASSRQRVERQLSNSSDPRIKARMPEIKARSSEMAKTEKRMKTTSKDLNKYAERKEKAEAKAKPQSVAASKTKAKAATKTTTTNKAKTATPTKNKTANKPRALSKAKIKQIEKLAVVIDQIAKAKIEAEMARIYACEDICELRIIASTIGNTPDIRRAALYRIHIVSKKNEQRENIVQSDKPIIDE